MTIGKMKSQDKAPHRNQGVRKGREHLCQICFCFFVLQLCLKQALPSLKNHEEYMRVLNIQLHKTEILSSHLPAVRPWLVTYSHFTDAQIKV